jgi:hypothetical protein
VSLFFERIDDARDAVFDARHLEVDEQAQPLVRQAEIGQKLLFVNWGENLAPFHIEYTNIINDLSIYSFNLQVIMVFGVYFFNEFYIQLLPSQVRRPATLRRLRPKSGPFP